MQDSFERKYGIGSRKEVLHGVGNIQSRSFAEDKVDVLTARSDRRIVAGFILHHVARPGELHERFLSELRPGRLIQTLPKERTEFFDGDVMARRGCRIIRQFERLLQHRNFRNTRYGYGDRNRYDSLVVVGINGFYDIFSTLCQIADQFQIDRLHIRIIGRSSRQFDRRDDLRYKLRTPVKFDNQILIILERIILNGRKHTLIRSQHKSFRLIRIVGGSGSIRPHHFGFRRGSSTPSGAMENLFTAPAFTSSENPSSSSNA